MVSIRSAKADLTNLQLLRASDFVRKNTRAAMDGAVLHDARREGKSRRVWFRWWISLTENCRLSAFVCDRLAVVGQRAAGNQVHIAAELGDGAQRGADGVGEGG